MDGTDVAMRPLMQAQLVNDRSGDPAVAIETLFEDRLILFDLGDLAAVPARKLHRVTDVFISHTHIDHFIGFDRLLRLLVGRQKTVRLWGPEGFIDRVRHKLHAYEWNLVGNYANDLALSVTEVISASQVESTEFHSKSAFSSEPRIARRITRGVLREEPTFRVSTALLEHSNAVSLAFAIEEPVHVNVWKNRLAERGLPVGPWLKHLKRAVMEDRPPDTPIVVSAAGEALPLSAVRDTVTVTRGQKIGYVTDATDTAANRNAIIDLVRSSDLLFIEAAFARRDAALAGPRGHLTTSAAGEIARAAEVRRIEPFHFSPRYAGEDAAMLAEVVAAFAGPTPLGGNLGPTPPRAEAPDPRPSTGTLHR